MIDNKSYITLFLALLGLCAYFFLRPQIEFYADGALSESRGEAELRISKLSEDLGFSTDSLAVTSVREQHTGYLKSLIDSTGTDLNPSVLNRNGAHIQTWVTIVGEKDKVDGFFTGYEELFDKAGRLKIRSSNHGKIIQVEAARELPNPTFVQGDSVIAVANKVAGEIIGYDLSRYTLFTDPLPDTLAGISEINQGSGLINSSGPALDFLWEKKKGESGPELLSLSLEPVVREINEDNAFRTEFGYRVHSFRARNMHEPADLVNAGGLENGQNLWFNYVFFASLLILVVLVFTIGLQKIFKGKVEWRKALFIFIALLITVYGWRALYFSQTYGDFLNSIGEFGTQLNSFLMSVAVALYGALAYIGWEALARDQKTRQIPLVDAVWQRKFFVRETGAALIHGFAVGGILIGLFSVMNYMGGNYILQADSQFGFAEAGLTPRLLSMNISAWSTTWLVVFAQFGLVYVLLRKWVSNSILSLVLITLFSALFTTVLGRLVGTTGAVPEDFVMYLFLAGVMVYALNTYGIFTVSTAWWVFSLFFLIQPYWDSQSIEVAYVGWVQAFILAGPLIYGFIAYRYGLPVSDVGDYIPEYEERLANHMRVEKEIEIARESQYKLMPLKPPVAEGIDVYGFFLPSFEVGGDYFDYILSKNGEGEAEALTMTVVDVSGKAMRAAMPAIFTSGLLLSRMNKDMPADILNQVNEPLFHRTDKRTFITCALARYDFNTRKISVANAGHCRPVLKRNGVAEFIQTPAPAYPLGIMQKSCYSAQDFKLKKGDFFLMYSDGLPEAVNDKGERFGFDEVPRLIEDIDTDSLSAQEIAQELKRTVQKFSNYQLADDTTIICLKV